MPLDKFNFTGSIYYVIGWGLPVFMTVAWAVVTGLSLKNDCWYGYNHQSYYYIVEGPRLAVIAVCYSYNLLQNILLVCTCHYTGI